MATAEKEMALKKAFRDLFDFLVKFGELEESPFDKAKKEPRDSQKTESPDESKKDSN